MLKFIATWTIIGFSVIALAQDSSNGLAVPGKFIKQGQSIQCDAEGGCVIMTVKELVDTANAIQRKVLENHVCGFKSEI